MAKKTMKEAVRRKRSQERTEEISWELIDRVLESENINSVLLWGPPGTGKTFAGYTNGRTQRGVWMCTLTQETPASELRGNFMPRGDSLVWEDGPVIRAMKEGARLVLNEISHASDDVLAFLHPILEDAATARMRLPSNEEVAPAPGFNVVVCDNESPDDLPTALADRFDSELHVARPHPDALAQLSLPLREAALRSFAIEGDRRVSIRSWLTLDRIRGEFGLEDACLVVFGAERGSQICDALRMAGGF